MSAMATLAKPASIDDEVFAGDGDIPLAVAPPPRTSASLADTLVQDLMDVGACVGSEPQARRVHHMDTFDSEILGTPIKNNVVQLHGHNEFGEPLALVKASMVDWRLTVFIHLPSYLYHCVRQHTCIKLQRNKRKLICI